MAPSKTTLRHVNLYCRTIKIDFCVSWGTPHALIRCPLYYEQDTDEARSSRESEESMLADLRWLGLEWDEGPDKEGEVRAYSRFQFNGML